MCKLGNGKARDAGLHTHKFADSAEIPSFQGNGAAEGKKRDDTVRAPDGRSLETMKRFIMRLAVLRGRPFMAKQSRRRYWWLFILKIAKKSAVWLENVRNIKGKDFFLRNFLVDGAGGKYFALLGNDLKRHKCAQKRNSENAVFEKIL